MKLKITHPEDRSYPSVVNAETGEEIEGVTAVIYSCDANTFPNTKVEISLVDVEAHLTVDSDDPQTVIRQTTREWGTEKN